MSLTFSIRTVAASALRSHYVLARQRSLTAAPAVLGAGRRFCKQN